MREIYQNAAKTFVWLGSASVDSDLAMNTILDLDKLADSGVFAVMSWSEFPFSKIAVNPMVDKVQTILREIIGELCRKTSARLKAIGSLFERSWFQRVWVIQERVLSKDCLVCCGDTWMSWDAFYDGFWVLCGVRDYLNIVGSGTGRRDSSTLVAFLTAALDRVTPVAFTRPNSSLLTLFSLLSRMSSEAQLQASDQRDYVFSLLGLVSPDSSPSIPVQYNKDWQTIRTEVAKACLIYYGPRILPFAGSGGVHKYTAALLIHKPSWAPDWSSKYLAQPLHAPSLFMVRGKNREKAYTASGSLSQSLSAAFLEENRFVIPLSLKAIRVGKIVKQGRTFGRLKGLKPDEADGIRASFLDLWLDDLDAILAGTPTVYNTDEALREALWRTPIADREFAYNWETERASGEMFLSYQALRQRKVSEGLKYVNVAIAKLVGRQPFVTDGGYIGLAPLASSVGDEVWIILGADAPFIISSRSLDKCSQIIGEAYVHGIMDGELLKGTTELQTLNLT
ncbi:ankyrin and HET domain-containing protein [Colletotrichum phormii]|uniref:Ankyrin and HET domain-containing protein n=1 Tax=Colletotrichum phormii TaxID=359342 RepID=A0AAI9ZFU5_9PEZI|nr:ankyrin and HET domain-containing protein [Colletotrichum phormii]KAK1623772.1 ankyrin and HET domain-containing protein [Colletotrichum phormii]